MLANKLMPANMVQPQLPLTYSVIIPSLKYALPLRWKAVFILLLIYSVSLSAIIYGKATRTYAQTAQTQITPVPSVTLKVPNATTPQVVGVGQVTMTATVSGWYEVEEIDNENILVKTNMQVWVNNREFVRCRDSDQKTIDLSWLEY